MSDLSLSDDELTAQLRILAECQRYGGFHHDATLCCNVAARIEQLGSEVARLTTERDEAREEWGYLQGAIREHCGVALSDIDDEHDFAADLEEHNREFDRCDAEARAAKSRLAEVTEALKLFTSYSMSESRPTRGESFIGWQEGDGPTASERVAIARAALSSTPATPPSRELGEAEDVGRIREALRPFAEVADWYDSSEDDSFIVLADYPHGLIDAEIMRLGNFRRARAALAAMPRTQEKTP